MKLNKNPIFIHSLFRSGSTYLFNVFRRSEAGYWCYQEALHEQVCWNSNNPKLLLDTAEGVAKQHRHPDINGAYWKELVDVWPAWKDTINEENVYEEYFSRDPEHAGCSYWRSLLEGGVKRVLFQECRTSGRILALKTGVSGHHIYLWRNPWDQWWSYKVATYFDTANQIIATSKYAPDCLMALCSALAIPAAPTIDLAGKFAFYNEYSLTSEQSYLLFYMLWCLALDEGNAHADTLINIDRLSESEEYRNGVLNGLDAAADIKGIRISDCQVPQALYDERDTAFFVELEEQVHDVLLHHGWSAENLNALQKLRAEYLPATQREQKHPETVVGLIEQSSRARGLARKYETDLADRSRIFQAELQQQKSARLAAEAQAEERDAIIGELNSEICYLQGKNEAWESALDVVQRREEARAEKAEGALREAALQLEQVKIQLNKSLSDVESWCVRAKIAEQNMAVLERQVNDFVVSTSWRMTAPIRSLCRAVSMPPVVKNLKLVMRRPSHHAALYISARPTLRRKIVSLLRKSPRLFSRIRRFAEIRGLVQSTKCFQPSKRQFFPTSSALGQADVSLTNCYLNAMARQDGDVSVDQVLYGIRVELAENGMSR